MKIAHVIGKAVWVISAMWSQLESWYERMMVLKKFSKYLVQWPSTEKWKII